MPGIRLSRGVSRCHTRKDCGCHCSRENAKWPCFASTAAAAGAARARAVGSRPPELQSASGGLEPAALAPDAPRSGRRPGKAGRRAGSSALAL
eukprot:8988787-Alexandrium_andersonii.AAC.1